MAIEQLNEQRNHWAFLAAVITNCTAALARAFSGSKRKLKLVQPDDFINKDFKKIIQQILGKQSSNKKPELSSGYKKHIQDARVKGLAGPW
jgi:hypothetical protein